MVAHKLRRNSIKDDDGRSDACVCIAQKKRYFFFLKNFFLSFFARNSPFLKLMRSDRLHFIGERRRAFLFLSTRTIFTPLRNTQRTYSFCILPRRKNTNPFFLLSFLKKRIPTRTSLSLSLSLSCFSSSSLSSDLERISRGNGSNNNNR